MFENLVFSLISIFLESVGWVVVAVGTDDNIRPSAEDPDDREHGWTVVTRRKPG